jgi:AraC-like DNA-binding protein
MALRSGCRNKLNYTDIEIIGKIESLYIKQRLKVGAVAECLGISVFYLRELIAIYGLGKNKTKNKKLTDEQKQEIYNLHLNKKSYEFIADRFGLSKKTIQRIVHGMDVRDGN